MIKASIHVEIVLLTKVSCLYCPSVVRYDGLNAHVKRQHPDVDIPKGFTRNFPNNGVRASKTEGLYTDPQSGYTNPIITLNGESCSC